MIAAPTRTYINRIINEYDSDLEELDFSFDPEEQAPETLQECGYHIGFGDISNISDSAQVIEDSVEVNITFMKSGFQCEVEEHQDFIDKVYCIKNNLVDYKDYDTGIIKVVSPSMTISPLDNNNNVMVIKVQMLFTYSVCF